MSARRPVLVLTCLLLAAACDRTPAKSASTTEFDGDAALRYTKAQLDFGPRIPNSSGARQAGDWIVAQMKARADTVIVQEFIHVTVTHDTLRLRNVLARFRPAATERVLYLTHWDTRPVSDESPDPLQRQLPVPGANDGASGVGLFVALADALKKTPPSVGVDLLFVDGEDYGDFTVDKDVLLGSRWFAKHLPSPDYRPLFGVLWDMIGDADLRIPQEQNSINAAPEVVARVWQAAQRLGYGSTFVSETMQPITDDHIPLIEAGLRVIDIIDYDYCCHHQPTDRIDKVSARSLKIVGDVALELVR